MPRICQCLYRTDGQPDSLVTLNPGAPEDLMWWLPHLDVDHEGMWAPFWFDELPIRARVIHDSSGDEAKGFGLLLDDYVYQGKWSVTGRAHSSAYRELIPMLLEVQLLADHPAVKENVLILTSDNSSMVYALLKGSCRSEDTDCLVLFHEISRSADLNKIYILGD